MPQIYPTDMGGALPVRDNSGARLPVQMIHAYVLVALGQAASDPHLVYRVQRDGWGYSWRDIEPAFAGAGENVRVPC